MGSHLPARVRKAGLGVVLAATLLTLSGCSAEEVKSFWVLFLPEPVTTDGVYIAQLWDWMWLAAWVIGAITWALMFYVAIRFRRRRQDEVPTQLRYHLPLEIFYTLVPLVLVLVIFVQTVRTQDAVAADDEEPADHVINVVGQKWSWTFNYEVDVNDDRDKTIEATPDSVFDVGTTAEAPTLYLPVDQTTRFELRSPDVIHSFWVPAFLFKMDVVPGRPNGFSLTPTEEGTYMGKCAELCGAYHSRMLFNVKVVSSEEYDAHLERLAARGDTGVATGSVFVNEQEGLETGSEEATE